MIGVFDLFTVGIGPSSSHTVGPMRAARIFVDRLDATELLHRVERVRVELFGSLGATGHGHGSAGAVVLGLQGEDPARVDLDTYADRVAEVGATRSLRLGGVRRVDFDPARDLVLHKRRSLPGHPNTMTFVALDADGDELDARTFWSVGGGFVVDAVSAAGTPTGHIDYPFASAGDLLAECQRTSRSVSEVALELETRRRSEAEVRDRLAAIWSAMSECIERGCRTDGTLPGGLGVRRRAAALRRDLTARPDADPLAVLDWVNLFALAVNEENAAGGRVVTAPTNGAAGIVPAVLTYWVRFVARPDQVRDGVARFLLTAGLIGTLIKRNASISGAEVGCQGEVGSACAMAAAGLAELAGGSPAQVENAAEIGIEHHLGLTCDPIGGLVQIPCIERNAVAAVQAINAARLAVNGDGAHHVSLDRVLAVMRRTGADMHARYKETSRGGLAVSVVEC